MRRLLPLALALLLVGCNFSPTGSRSSASPAPASPTNSAPSGSSLAGFGKVPTPALHGPAGGQNQLPPGATFPYYGPAKLRWAGALARAIKTAPVLRYREVQRTEADAFATRLKASNSGEPSQPPLVASYNTTDSMTLVVLSTEPNMGLEPRYVLTPPGSEFAGSRFDPVTARQAAAAFLSKYQLNPSWPNRVLTDPVQEPSMVIYDRVFDVAPAVTAFQVNGAGDPTGINVTMSGSKVFQVEGPLPLPLAPEKQDYPLRTPDAALAQALNAPPLPEAAPLEPTPAVTLNAARLVYLVVSGSGQGFFEPAYLFTGTFKVGSQAYEKRVLVPAIDASYLSNRTS